MNRKIYTLLALLAIFACSRKVEQICPEAQKIRTYDIKLAPLEVEEPKETKEPEHSIELDKPCPDDMVEVQGDFCPEVRQVCKRWLDTDTRPTANSGIGPMRCAEFSESTCLSKKRVPMHFCMNRYESQNKEGQLPIIGMDWYEAKASCNAIGKRLCTNAEWTFACEGEDIKPYPYGDGMHRDESICDQTHDPMPAGTSRSKWNEYYQGHESGSYPNCHSDQNVYDMVAGVDEWIYNESRTPYVSGLKGGYGTYAVRTRCRASTLVHGPTFSYYQVGFRCCKNTQ